MKINADSGIWAAMFGVPCIVADNLLKLATGDQLKVLLYVLRHSGNECTDDEIAKNTGISVQQAGEAVMFWQQVNILPSDSAAQVQGMSTIMSAPQPAGNPAEVNTKPQSRAETRKKQTLQPSEISALMKDSADISELFKTAEGLLGTLTHTQQNSLIWMFNYLGLKKEVIITLLAYCISIDKTNSAYIEKIAYSWSENEINTLSAAQDEVSRLTETMEYSTGIKKLFSMNRNPTANEKEILSSWRANSYSDELIYYAYEISLERINKLSFKYINSILENWKKIGYTTVSDVKEAENAYKKAKRDDRNTSADDSDVDKYKIFINNF